MAFEVDLSDICPISRLQSYIRDNVTITPTGCWIWGKLSQNGYGYLTIPVYIQNMFNNKESIATHIVTYKIYKDIKYNFDAQIRHQCHVKLCCNPDHLLKGTAAQNRQDSSSLTWEDIRYIRTSTLTNVELADYFKLSAASIHKIIKNKTWKDVNYIAPITRKRKTLHIIPKSGYTGVMIVNGGIGYMFQYNNIKYQKFGFSNTYEAALARNLKIFELGLQIICG